jgi:hypothetical protein
MKTSKGRGRKRLIRAFTHRQQDEGTRGMLNRQPAACLDSSFRLHPSAFADSTVKGAPPDRVGLTGGNTHQSVIVTVEPGTSIE